ncbi:hypothetical protein [Arthrobacter sp. A5]
MTAVTAAARAVAVVIVIVIVIVILDFTVPRTARRSWTQPEPPE